MDIICKKDEVIGNKILWRWVDIKGWYDIHNHMLPGVDDGAKDWKEAKNMLKLAYQEGISNIIVTPHFNMKWKITPKEALLEYKKKLQEMAYEISEEYHIYLGNEIYYHHDAAEHLDQKKIFSLADSSYVLVEFSPVKEYEYIENALYQLQIGGYMPILAHAERYECLRKNTENLADLVDRGIYIQVNASSIMKEASFLNKKFIRKLLDKDLVHFIGTDTHNLSNRPPLIKKCAHYIEKRYGKERVDRLLIHNPEQILRNKTIGT
ncbi:MAG TPA: hypothetical protein IAC41_06260 [Candidatus Merdenecus merdavium]|nr:hypothetical protein [Candidatus Merdenecus merdavium]